MTTQANDQFQNMKAKCSTMINEDNKESLSRLLKLYIPFRANQLFELNGF
jgi:hypothetical protein